jgi:hypothetical protein
MKRKQYPKPEIRRVRLEDKNVVAMAVCDHRVAGRFVVGDRVFDQAGPVLTYDPSL